MTTTTAVATTQGTAVAAYQEPFDDGLGALDSGDLIIPRLIITQKTTPGIETENIGKFFINLTGEFFNSMRLTTLKLTKGRILWPNEYDKDNEPLCRSHDFAYPADDIQNATPMASSCGLLPGDPKKHVCPYADWTLDKKGKPKPPQCSELWNLLVLDLDSYMPMFFTVKSTGIKPAKKFYSAVNIIGKAKNIPMWNQEFTINLMVANFDSGPAYIPSFVGPKQLSAEESEVVNSIRYQMADVDMRTDDAADNAPSTKPAEPEEAEQF